MALRWWLKVGAKVGRSANLQILSAAVVISEIFLGWLGWLHLRGFTPL